jgi:predicted small lipoprotein YifL
MAGSSGMRLALIIAALVGTVMLAACGKKGPPSPPGPPDQITWPRIYPTH